MPNKPCILLIGTADTKGDELLYLRARVESAGASVRVMDVGVLGDPPFEPDYSKHAVAEAAGTTNREIIDLGNEHQAMTRQAEGAASLAAGLQAEGTIDGMLAIGGSMATDLALDVCEALPLGTPKFIVSTIAFSPLLPPNRISPDVMMILWAGGLYGLNSICKSVLSQAAGAVVGACGTCEKPQSAQPIVGMTSLGSSSLKYMLALKPEIERRGFELAVFHTTGMGGRALESLASQGRLAAVMDFCLVEVSNHTLGSVVSAGADRLEAAGANGVPQIVAPGGITLVDMQSWAPPPDRFRDREVYTHNRMVACTKLTATERVEAARAVAAKLMRAQGPTTFVMPRGGIDEWDKEGGPFNDAEGLTAFADEVRRLLKPPVEHIEIDAHINDAKFAETVLRVFDRWLQDGTVTS